VKPDNGRILLSPSDVTAYLACEHLTTLSLRAARGDIARPDAINEQAELLFRKGLEHEQAYLERLRGEGRDVRVVDVEAGFESAAEATREALAEGVEIVYQAVLVADGWRGVADFLMRQPDGSYEVLDTKLARTAKPAYILQLCFYSEQLALLQGREPEHIHVLLGSGEQQSFRPREFDAYARRVRTRLEEFVRDEPATEPYPCDHCGICDFLPVCGARWDEVDHLCRVAGLYRSQIERLQGGGIATLAALARAEACPPGVNPDAFEKLRRQARLQLHRRLLASRSCRTLHPVISSSTLKATRSGTSRARSSTCGACSTPPAASTRCSPRIIRASGARSKTSSTASTHGLRTTPVSMSITTPPTRSRRCAG
jgi:predicted RecB family nuclease